MNKSKKLKLRHIECSLRNYWCIICSFKMDSFTTAAALGLSACLITKGFKITKSYLEGRKKNEQNQLELVVSDKCVADQIDYENAVKEKIISTVDYGNGETTVMEYITLNNGHVIINIDQSVRVYGNICSSKLSIGYTGAQERLENLKKNMSLGSLFSQAPKALRYGTGECVCVCEGDCEGDCDCVCECGADCDVEDVNNGDCPTWLAAVCVTLGCVDKDEALASIKGDAGQLILELSYTRNIVQTVNSLLMLYVFGATFRERQNKAGNMIHEWIGDGSLVIELILSMPEDVRETFASIGYLQKIGSIAVNELIFGQDLTDEEITNYCCVISLCEVNAYLGYALVLRGKNPDISDAHIERLDKIAQKFKWYEFREYVKKSAELLKAYLSYAESSVKSYTDDDGSYVYVPNKEGDNMDKAHAFCEFYNHGLEWEQPQQQQLCGAPAPVFETKEDGSLVVRQDAIAGSPDKTSAARRKSRNPVIITPSPEVYAKIIADDPTKAPKTATKTATKTPTKTPTKTHAPRRRARNTVSVTDAPKASAKAPKSRGNRR